MKSFHRRLRHVLICALAFAPLTVLAQEYGYPGYRGPQYFVGGSIGVSVFADNSNSIAGWLNSAYSSTTALAPGDFISSSGSQDRSSLGARVYGGAWFTPNVGVEVGFASLGSVGWSVDSINTTGSFSVSDSGTADAYAFYEAMLLGFDNAGVRYFGKLGVYEAWTDLNATSFDNNSGGSFSASQTVHNTGAVLGLGLTTLYGPFNGLRLEVEDYLNVGQSSTTQIPPWRGNIVMLSAGYTFLS